MCRCFLIARIIDAVAFVGLTHQTIDHGVLGLNCRPASVTVFYLVDRMRSDLIEA